MGFAPRFRQGAKAAIPIWIAFVPSSLAWGIAAQAHGLKLDEVILMSAWVYSGPGQFAVLVPLAEGKSSLQVLVAGFLMNLRFLPMSTALAPYFNGVKRLPLLFASHVISASSFIVPYLQFQKEREGVSDDFGASQPIDGYMNLAFFLGVGATSFFIWVVGTGVGYGVALGFPPGFEEALKFILPGYFAGLLVVEMKGRAMPLMCAASLLAAIPGALVSSRWGMARELNFGCDFGLGIGTVEITRIVIILIMGLMAFAVRAAPQIFFVGQKFPEAWDRLLRYLSYAFICSIIAVTLFMSAGKFETQAAPYRGVALAVTIIIAHKTKSAVTGMLVGMVLVLLFSWIR